MSHPARSQSSRAALSGPARSTLPTVRRRAAVTVTSATDTLEREETGLRRRPELPRFHGRYVLEQRIGVGGMGTVYRARPVDGGDPVALKALSDHLGGIDAARRFTREIEALKQLRHPNVVRLLDHGWVADRPFYVMELVRGPDLTRLVTRDGPQPANRVCAIVRQLADALAHAHERGFVHRDIKPSNVVLDFTPGVGEVAKLADFGLVLTRGDLLRERMTAEDMLLGTPGYIAPEGAQSSRWLGPRSDLYALAMIAYYLRTGHHLFRPVDIVVEESHRAALERGWHRLREAGGLPSPLEHVLWRCLRFDRRRRPASAQHLVDVLDALPFAPVWPRDEAARWWEGYAATTRPQDKAR